MKYRVGKDIVEAKSLEEAHEIKGIPVPANIKIDNHLPEYTSGRRSNKGLGGEDKTKYITEIKHKGRHA